MKTEQRKRKLPVPGWLIGTGIGLVLLVLGVFNDQLADIYRKAVMICMECIGLG